MFSVCGERRSGTNYIISLLQKNFPDLNYDPQPKKHSFPWVDLPDQNVLIDQHDQNFYLDRKKSLFVFIVRNPYDWVRGVYRNSYDRYHKDSPGDFDHFITSTWYSNFKRDLFNPYTLEAFDNVLSLRSYKIKSNLLLGRLLDNFIVVRYEDIAIDPQGFIEELKEKIQINLETPFTSHVYAKWSDTQVYRRKPYRLISQRQLNIINESLDWDAERSVGYDKWSLWKINTSYFR